MKLNQFALTIVSVLSLSVSAFAKNDTNLFNALSDAGVQWEEEMSKGYVGVTDLACGLSAPGQLTCTMIDTAMAAEGARVTVTGAKAQAIVSALEMPLPAQGPLKLRGVTCFRDMDTLVDIHEGEQAVCDVN